MTTASETPPTRERSKADIATSKIGIGIVVLLALVALVVGVSSGGSKSSGVKLLAASTPTSVSIPAIGATSSLIATGLKKDGSLEVPPLATPMQASWWSGSPTPGSLGPAVILGHVNGGGKPGIFYRLKDVRAGEQILVNREDGQTAVFTVSNIDTVPKAGFPPEVWADTPDSQLRVITCGGQFDPAAKSYEANVVVYANLTEVRKT